MTYRKKKKEGSRRLAHRIKSRNVQHGPVAAVTDFVSNKTAG